MFVQHQLTGGIPFDGGYCVCQCMIIDAVAGTFCSLNMGIYIYIGLETKQKL